MSKEPRDRCRVPHTFTLGNCSIIVDWSMLLVQAGHEAQLARVMTCLLYVSLSDLTEASLVNRPDYSEWTSAGHFATHFKSKVLLKAVSQFFPDNELTKHLKTNKQKLSSTHNYTKGWFTLSMLQKSDANFQIFLTEHIVFLRKIHC